MPFILMILISAGWTIADCCGAGMLETMWFQVSLIETGSCGEIWSDACVELLTSLGAECSACLDCPPKADG